MKTKTIELNSRRQYRCFFSECGPDGHPTDHSIQNIISHSVNDDYEWAPALCERLDDVLDLAISETMHFYPNRDAKSKLREHALIKRIR